MAGKNFDISRFAGTIAPVRSESDTMREIAIDKILDNPRNFYPKPDTKALAALEIARMDLDEQYRLLDWMIDKGRSYTINEVRKFDTCYHSAKKVEQQPTPETEPLPEGQMVICGWMPGGTTPAEPGEFAVVVDVGGGKRLKRFFEWDGRRWMMTGGIEARIAPAWWMRLPPVPDKEG